jgi:hypothetical protein
MRIELTLDCVDLNATAAFWQGALGYVWEATIDERYVTLSGDGPSLTLQQAHTPGFGAGPRELLEKLTSHWGAAERQMALDFGGRHGVPHRRLQSSFDAAVRAD